MGFKYQHNGKLYDVGDKKFTVQLTSDIETNNEFVVEVKMYYIKDFELELEYEAFVKSENIKSTILQGNISIFYDLLIDNLIHNPNDITILYSSNTSRVTFKIGSDDISIIMNWVEHDKYTKLYNMRYGISDSSINNDENNIKVPDISSSSSLSNDYKDINNNINADINEDIPIYPICTPPNQYTEIQNDGSLNRSLNRSLNISDEVVNSTRIDELENKVAKLEEQIKENEKQIEKFRRIFRVFSMIDWGVEDD